MVLKKPSCGKRIPTKSNWLTFFSEGDKTTSQLYKNSYVWYVSRLPVMLGLHQPGSRLNNAIFMSSWRRKGDLLWLTTVPSGKHTKNYGKSPFGIGKSTVNEPCSIAMLIYQRVCSITTLNGCSVGTVCCCWISILGDRIDRLMIVLLVWHTEFSIPPYGQKIIPNDVLFLKILLPKKHVLSSCCPLKNAMKTEIRHLWSADPGTPSLTNTAWPPTSMHQVHHHHSSSGSRQKL